MSHDEELKPLTPDLEALLDAERGVPPAPGELRARVRGRLAASLGIAALGAGSAHAAGATPAAGSTALRIGSGLAGRPLLLKLALGVVGAVGVGVAVHVALRPATRSPGPLGVGVHAALRPPDRPHIPLAAYSDPVDPAPPAAAPAALPVRAPSGLPAAASVPVPSAPERVTHAARHLDPSSELAAERRLLDEGRAALARGDHAAALAALTRHRREFPHGQLAEERDSLLIGALAQAGRADEARARAAAFRAHHPRSIFLPAVEATLSSLK